MFSSVQKTEMKICFLYSLLWTEIMEAGSDAGEVHLEKQEWLRHFLREFMFKLDLIDPTGKGPTNVFGRKLVLA